MHLSDDLTTALPRLLHAVDTWHGGAVPPRGFRLRQDEALYRVDRGVELVELTRTQAPLQGGTSDLVVADALRMAGTEAATTRGVWCSEDVPALDTGELLVTDQRVVLVGEDFRREWSFAELLDVTHDPALPETWFLVRSRERVSGLRCGGAEALDLRFAVALALASARGERARLRQALLGQVPPRVPAPAGTLAKLRGALALVYLGKRGVAAPLRALQGVVAVLVTLVLLSAAVGGGSGPETTALAVTTATDTGAAGTRAAAETARQQADAARAAADEAVADKAAADGAAAARAAAAQAAADDAAAQKAAADQAAAVKAAADKAAADKAAADRAAAVKAAADRAAADRAAADRAAADQAAADQAAAERAAEAAAAAEATRKAAARSPSTRSPGCQPAYPDFCVPVGADLDCPDFSQNDFTALAADPYRLDQDNDGIACES